MRIVLLPVLALLLAGCLKTAGQVRREQQVESMSQQMSDSQGLMADLTVSVKNMQTQLDAMNGRLEESERAHSEARGQDLRALSESVTLLKQQVQALMDNQQKQDAELQQQRAFIEKVTERLGQIGQGGGATKKNPKSDVQAAWKLIRAKNYAGARRLLEGLLDDPEVGAADQNKALHALGILEYEQKNYEKGLAFFSRLYTKYPRSSLAPDSLLHIGRSLRRLGKKDEARQAFEEVRASYGGTGAAGQAQKELRNL